MRDEQSKKRFYPLPTVTAEMLQAVYSACSRVSPEADLTFCCIRDEKVTAVHVTAILQAVLPDAPDDEPILVGKFMQAIKLHQESRQIERVA